MELLKNGWRSKGKSLGEVQNSDKLPDDRYFDVKAKFSKSKREGQSLKTSKSFEFGIRGKTYDSDKEKFRVMLRTPSGQHNNILYKPVFTEKFELMPLLSYEWVSFKNQFDFSPKLINGSLIHDHRLRIEFADKI